MIFVLSVFAAGAALTPTAATLEADKATHAVILTAHAEGAQVYQCKAGADGVLSWSFREPIATLLVDGKTIGRHYAGPHWALDDGSLVQGKLAASAPGATTADIALLKLSVIANQGAGALGSATLVYRLNTHGGALTGNCATAGQLQSVAYSADYSFAR